MDVQPLITKKVSFKEAETAFHEVKASKGIKTLIEGVADDGVVSSVLSDIVAGLLTVSF